MSQAMSVHADAPFTEPHDQRQPLALRVGAAVGRALLGALLTVGFVVLSLAIWALRIPTMLATAGCFLGSVLFWHMNEVGQAVEFAVLCLVLSAVLAGMHAFNKFHGG